MPFFTKIWNRFSNVIDFVGVSGEEEIKNVGRLVGVFGDTNHKVDKLWTLKLLRAILSERGRAKTMDWIILETY